MAVIVFVLLLTPLTFAFNEEVFRESYESVPRGIYSDSLSRVLLTFDVGEVPEELVVIPSTCPTLQNDTLPAFLSPFTLYTHCSVADSPAVMRDCMMSVNQKNLYPTSTSVPIQSQILVGGYTLQMLPVDRLLEILHLDGSLLQALGTGVATSYVIGQNQTSFLLGPIWFQSPFLPARSIRVVAKSLSLYSSIRGLCNVSLTMSNPILSSMLTEMGPAPERYKRDASPYQNIDEFLAVVESLKENITSCNQSPDECFLIKAAGQALVNLRNRGEDGTSETITYVADMVERAFKTTLFHDIASSHHRGKRFIAGIIAIGMASAAIGMAAVALKGIETLKKQVARVADGVAENARGLKTLGDTVIAGQKATASAIQSLNTKSDANNKLIRAHIDDTGKKFAQVQAAFDVNNRADAITDATLEFAEDLLESALAENSLVLSAIMSAITSTGEGSRFSNIYSALLKGQLPPEAILPADLKSLINSPDLQQAVNDAGRRLVYSDTDIAQIYTTAKTSSLLVYTNVTKNPHLYICLYLPTVSRTQYYDVYTVLPIPRQIPDTTGTPGSYVTYNADQTNNYFTIGLSYYRKSYIVIPLDRADCQSTPVYSCTMGVVPQTLAAAGDSPEYCAAAYLATMLHNATVPEGCLATWEGRPSYTYLQYSLDNCIWVSAPEYIGSVNCQDHSMVTLTTQQMILSKQCLPTTCWLSVNSINADGRLTDDLAVYSTFQPKSAIKLEGLNNLQQRVRDLRESFRTAAHNTATALATYPAEFPLNITYTNTEVQTAIENYAAANDSATKSIAVMQAVFADNEVAIRKVQENADKTIATMEDVKKELSKMPSLGGISTSGLVTLGVFGFLLGLADTAVLVAVVYATKKNIAVGVLAYVNLAPGGREGGLPGGSASKYMDMASSVIGMTPVGQAMTLADLG